MSDKKEYYHEGRYKEEDVSNVNGIKQRIYELELNAIEAMLACDMNPVELEHWSLIINSLRDVRQNLRPPNNLVTYGDDSRVVTDVNLNDINDPQETGRNEVAEAPRMRRRYR